eukprot:3722779-Heterocapsa_arctica.AAC.1
MESPKDLADRIGGSLLGIPIHHLSWPVPEPAWVDWSWPGALGPAHFFRLFHELNIMDIAEYPAELSDLIAEARVPAHVRLAVGVPEPRSMSLESVYGMDNDYLFERLALLMHGAFRFWNRIHDRASVIAHRMERGLLSISIGHLAATNPPPAWLDWAWPGAHREML